MRYRNRTQLGGRSSPKLGVDFQCRVFFVRTCVKFTLANIIEAMHERLHESVKVEPHSTSRLSSALFYLAYILFTRLKFTCVNVRSQNRVSGNQR